MPERVTEVVQLPELPAGNAPAQSAQRATSLPLAPVDVAQGDAASRAREALLRFGALFAIPAGTSLLHAQPPSLRQAHDRHKEAAKHWEAGLIRWPRHLWGYGHTAFKALLHIIEWVTESPARFIVAVLFLAACWLWL